MEDILRFPQSNEFCALLKNGKFALFSNKDKKFITDFLFEKVSYCPEGRYFVVRKDAHNMLIDTRGKKIDFPVFYPNNFLMEALRHLRIYSKDRELFLRVQNKYIKNKKLENEQ